MVSDEALMLAVRNGDLEGLSVLFERHHRPLFGFFTRMTEDRAAAEDLVQEVFLRVLKYRHTYRIEAPFTAWLFHIARNAHRDLAARRRVTDGLRDDVELATGAPGPSAQLEQREDAALLREALRRLPADKRELIVLARYRGLTYAELGAVMDADAGTMRVRLHRAVRQLQQIFCALQGEESRCDVKTSATG